MAGIDPSLSATGLAWPDGSLETIKTKPADKDWRLVEIAKRVSDGVRGQNPSIVAMEDLPRNARSAGVTGMVQGVIRRELQSRGVPYFLVVPSTLKKAATGNGRASKSEMLDAYTGATGLINRDDNQIDAYWLRQVGLALTGQEHTLADTSTIGKIGAPPDWKWAY